MVVLGSQMNCGHLVGPAAGIRRTARVEENSDTPIAPTFAGFPQEPRPLHGLQYGFPDDGEVLSELAGVVATDGAVGE